MKKEQNNELLLSIKDEIINTVKTEVNEVKSQLKDEIINTVKTEINDFKSQINSKLEENDRELRSISRSVSKIEVEHGSNIQALLDGQVGIFEKLKSFEEKFHSHDIILDEHSDRIWNLESKVGII